MPARRASPRSRRWSSRSARSHLRCFYRRNALDLQLLGGLWILQTLPALVFGLFTRWFRAEGLLLGWAVGILWGSWTAWSNGLKPLASISLGGSSHTFYVGLGALVLNIAVAAVATLVLSRISPNRRSVTAPS
jgi:SSS family solute:Na+ symporter